MFYNLLVSSSKRIRFFFSLLERKIPRRSSGSIGKLSQRIYIYKVVHSPCNPEAGNPLMQPRLSAAVCHDDVCHPFLPPPSRIHRSSFLHRFGFSSEVDHCGDHLIACTRVEDPIPPIKLSHFLMPKGNAVCLLACWLAGCGGGRGGSSGGGMAEEKIGR